MPSTLDGQDRARSYQLCDHRKAMRLVMGLLALTLAACTSAPKATATPTPTAAPTLAPPSATPTPIVFMDVNYLAQDGSHWIVRLDITNHGAERATGYPLLRLYFKALPAGTLCGDRISIDAGASIRTQFERRNGPATLSDGQTVDLVTAC